jgi:HPt (histidine-containing phosphotransfer) domain-containing protein
MTNRAATCEPKAQVDLAVSTSERCLLRAKLDELSFGDSAIAQRYIRLLIDTNETTFLILRDAVDGASWHRIESAAHRIAGSMRLLDCNGMVDLLMRLEAAARAHDVALVRTLFSVAARSIDYLDTALAEIAESIAGN